MSEKMPRFQAGDRPIYFPAPAWGHGIPVLARLGTQVEVVEALDHGSFFSYDVRFPNGRLTRHRECDLRPLGEAPLVVSYAGWVTPLPRAAPGNTVVYQPQEWFVPFIGEKDRKYFGQVSKVVEVYDQGDFFSYLLVMIDGEAWRVVDHELAATDPR